MVTLNGCGYAARIGCVKRSSEVRKQLFDEWRNEQCNRQMIYTARQEYIQAHTNLTLDKLGAKCFAFDCAEVEAAVVSHKSYDGFELTLDKGVVVADDGDAEGGDDFAVVVLDFGDGDVEAALQAADNAFDDAALILERFDTVQMQVCCHHADYHRKPRDCRSSFLKFQLRSLVLHD